MSSVDPNAAPDTSGAADAQALVTLSHAVYALQAIGVFTLFTLIVGVIMDYVKRDDAAGTFLASHFRWRIRTFWFFLLWETIGVMTYFILIGFVIGWLVFASAHLWLMYRVIKGWLYLLDRKPMYRAPAV